MAENMAAAQQVYQTVCDALDERKWTYHKEEEKLLIHFGVNGDDVPMNFIIIVDADRQILRVLSPLPFTMNEDKRMDGAIATCVATFGMADGGFDYDLSNGRIVFRACAAFRDCTIGVRLVHYLIELTCAMVDKYNDQFLALNKGILSLQDFIANR